MKTEFPKKWSSHIEVESPVTSKSELHLQSQVVQWFWITYPEYRICTISSLKPIGGTEQLRSLLYHNLNNARSVVAAIKLNASGMVHGMLDMFLAVPAGDYHGLYIELKVPGKKPKPDQIEVGLKLMEQGYAVAWCDTFEDCIQLIISYLALKG